MRLLKFLVVIVVLAFLALTGYAYLGDMAPRQQEMRQPVALDTGAPAAAAAPTSTPAAEEATAQDDAEPAAEQAPADAETAPEGAEETDSNGLD